MKLTIDLEKVIRVMLSRLSRGIALRHLDRDELEPYYQYNSASKDLKLDIQVPRLQELEDLFKDILIDLEIYEDKVIKHLESKIFKGV